MHTMDVMHVIEKLWIASECLFREGTEPLRRWISKLGSGVLEGAIKNIIGKRRDHGGMLPTLLEAA